MFKNLRLVILFDMFLYPSFEMTTSFSNIAIELQLAQVKIYTKKVSNHQELGLFV